LINATVIKGQYVDVPVTISNLGGSTLAEPSLATSASAGLTATVINGLSGPLAPGESRNIVLRIAADLGSPSAGTTALRVETSGVAGEVNASVTVVNGIPVITTAPSYIDTGLVTGSQNIQSFNVTNTGYDTLKNPRIDGPSLPWLSLTIDKNIGDCLDSTCADRGILTGQSKTVGIAINPGDTVAQGIYNDRIVIYADNHIPYTYNIQVTLTSSAVGSVQFSILDQLTNADGSYRQVGGASILLQSQSVTSYIKTITTAADGSVLLTDIPEGRYSYNITAAGHKPYGGSFTITPGVWTNVAVGLEVNLVTVEWSVTPTTIQDQYQVTINQIFETNVPAPVLVTEPPSITFPQMQPGQVFNGEFTVTNYGLIAVDNVTVNFPTSFDDFDVEILTTTMPKQLGAMQKITVPYRITRRQAVASSLGVEPATLGSLFEEVQCYGGGCYKTVSLFAVNGTSVICPNSPQARTVDVSTNYTGQVPGDCPSASGGSSGGGSAGGGSYITSVGTGGASQKSGTPGPGVSTPIKTENPCDCKSEGTSCPDDGDPCTEDKCVGGKCSHPLIPKTCSIICGSIPVSLIVSCSKEITCGSHIIEITAPRFYVIPPQDRDWSVFGEYSCEEPFPPHQSL
jgi:large repetitive protein